MDWWNPCQRPAARRGRRLSAAVTLTVLIWGVLANTSAVWSATPLESLVRRLSSPGFAERQKAEQELEGLLHTDSAVLSVEEIEQLALNAARQGDAEQVTRVMSLLERLLIGGYRDPMEPILARTALVASAEAFLQIRRAGTFAETEQTRQAEEALVRLSESGGLLSAASSEVLTRHALLLENRAIVRLRKMGARVVFAPSGDPVYSSLMAMSQPSGRMPGDANPLNVVIPHNVQHLYLLPEWKGGAEGLALIARLHLGESLQVYLIDGCGVTHDDLLPLRSRVAGLNAMERGAATLGVQWASWAGNADSVEISNVQPGLAAEKAGLRRGYQILALDGESITRFEDGTNASLVHRLRSYKPGQEMIMSVRSSPGAQVRDLKVILSGWNEVPDIMDLRNP